MINLIEIINENGDVLPLPLADPSSGIIVKSIDGLGPVKAELVSSDFALQDGGIYQTSRRGSRNIVMIFDLDPRYGGESVEAIRNRMYDHFMPGQNIKIVLHKTSGLVLETNGVVEDFVTPMFERDIRVGATIVCHDPALYGQEVFMLDREGYGGALAEHEIIYGGTLPTGINLEINISAGNTTTGFTLQHRLPGKTPTTLQFAAPLNSLDTIFVNTHPGKKSATRRRSGVDTPILYGVDPQSIWTTLSPGSQHVGVMVSGMQSYYEITWRNKYGGV